jgi:hypothetical protein
MLVHGVHAKNVNIQAYFTGINSDFTCSEKNKEA